MQPVSSPTRHSAMLVLRRCVDTALPFANTMLEPITLTISVWPLVPGFRPLTLTNTGFLNSRLTAAEQLEASRTEADLQSQSNRLPIFLPLNRKVEESRGGDAVIARRPHIPLSSPPATSVPSGRAEHRGQGWQLEQSRSSGVRQWFDEASVCFFDCDERDGGGGAGGKLR
nr:hypothetical protein Iba_chr14aCG11710 [Ipomoea batatas]